MTLSPPSLAQTAESDPSVGVVGLGEGLLVTTTVGDGLGDGEGEDVTTTVGLGEGLGETLTRGLGDGLGLGEGLGEALTRGLGEGLGLGDGLGEGEAVVVTVVRTAFTSSSV